MTDAVMGRLRQAIGRELRDAESVLLAVSGGIDSMVLLDAAVASRPPGTIRVGTFDHASGPHSARAVDLVERVALNASVSVVVGTVEAPGRQSEAAWRDVRMTFLHAAAAEHQSVLCTAHTRDDQIETVLFRALRGAGARGLAGLRASGPIRRPLLSFSRSDIERYARAARVEWVEDPTNSSRSHARNRLRHDVLPALRSTDPSIDDALFSIGEKASRWRADLDAAVDSLIDFTADQSGEELQVSNESLGSYDRDTLAVIWPALLARIGIAADWRGTRRLVEFTKKGLTSRRIQLSGGWVVTRRRQVFEVRRREGTTEPAHSAKGQTGIIFLR